MNFISVFLLTSFICLCSLCLWSGENQKAGKSGQFSVLKGEYLGQEKPGVIPEMFAPGIISTPGGFEFSITFSADGKTAYFTRRAGKTGRNTIMVITMVKGQWTEPKIAPFSGQYFDFEPNFSPDSQRLYFGTMRPLKKDGPPGDLHQWVLEKIENGWSAPKPLGSPFLNRFVMYPTETNHRTIYFTGQDGIYCSRYAEGKYKEPEKLSDRVNHLPTAAHPFIAPDESYLIFDAQPGGEYKSELFISFAKADGTWTKAKKMGEKIDGTLEDMCPTVSPDGKYFFFSRKGDIYWVDAQILEKFREE